MAYSNFADYKASIDEPQQILFTGNSSSATVTARLHDFWAGNMPVAGAQPSTAAATTSASTGAVPFTNGGANRLTLNSAFIGGNPGVFILCDRLSHQGGLSGTVTTAQTTNLPTAALTRYTDGVGVMMGLTQYVTIGATGASVQASYTNSSGTSGRTTPLCTFGGSGFREAGRLILLPLASGDVGVRAVASVTVSATTGTAGNFGVTLFKPLAMFNVAFPLPNDTSDITTRNFYGGLPEIPDNACLFWLALCYTAVTQASCVLNLTEV